MSNDYGVQRSEIFKVDYVFAWEEPPHLPSHLLDFKVQKPTFK